MKSILFTDLHLGVHGNSSIWLESAIKLANEILDKCEEENIKKVFFLGDFFHERRSLNNRTLNFGLEFGRIFERAKVDLYLIVGNHDTYFKNSLEPHSIKIFEKFKYVHCVDELINIDDVVTLVPWMTAWNKVKTPFIMGHFDINGCELSENWTNAHGEFKIGDFKRFNQVFSGHFHTPSVNSNVMYIGSCMPFTFHDVNSKRGYYILDIDAESNEFDLDFVEFHQCPKYKIYNYSDDFTKKDVKDNIIKIIYDVELTNLEADKFAAKLTKMEPMTVYSDFTGVADDNESFVLSDTEFIKSNKDLLFKYIDISKHPEFINKKTLKSMINKLI